jgi:hypothetical protein
MKTNEKLGMSLAMALAVAVGAGCGTEKIGFAGEGSGGEVIAVEDTSTSVANPAGGGGGTAGGEGLLQVEGTGPDGDLRSLTGGGGGGGSTGPLVAHLRLRGDDAGMMTFFGMEVAEVEVTVGGNALPTVLAPETGLDLAWTAHAWLLGAFEIPEDATEVDFKVRFAPTASFETARGTDWVDTRNPPITFTATRDQLSLRGHAVIHLNLLDSVHWTDSGYVLVPRATTRY